MAVRGNATNDRSIATGDHGIAIACPWATMGLPLAMGDHDIAMDNHKSPLQLPHITTNDGGTTVHSHGSP